MPLNHPGLPHPLLDSLSHSFRKRKGHRNTQSDEARSFLNLFAWHLLLELLMLPAPRMDTCEIDPNAVGKLQEKHGDNNAISIRQADVCLTIFWIESQNCRYTTKSLETLLMECSKITTACRVKEKTSRIICERPRLSFCTGVSLCFGIEESYVSSSPIHVYSTLISGQTT